MKFLHSLSAFLLFAASLTASLPCGAQTEVTPYRPGVTTEGITYFLPTTGLHIVVRAHRVTYAPGPYAAFAERFLEARNVEQLPTETWTLTDIDLEPFGTANREQAYTIKLNPKTSAPLVSLAPDGCLLAVNAQAPAVSALTQPSVIRSTPRTSSRSVETQEMLRAGNLRTKAELAAQEIYDLRENRNLLIKGQAEFNPKDGEQLRLMLEKIDQQEAALTAMFVGTTTEDDHVFTFDYMPTKDVEADEIFRFSRHLGLVERDDLAGNPIYIEVKNQNTLPEETPDPKADKKKPTDDLRYCNPGTARIRLFTADRTFVDQMLSLAQFGRIEHLGGALFNKKFNTRVLLSPTTGHVEKLDLETQGQ